MRGWIKFLAVLATALVVLALIGPGSPSTVRQPDDHRSIAALFMEDPTYWQSVGINLLFLTLFMAVVLVAVRVRSRKRRRSGSDGPDHGVSS